MEGEFKGTERFEIVSRLGAGGMGVVYRAYDHRRGAPIALKTLHRLDPASILRLKQEFRTIAHVAHPNLVTLHELVSEGELWFFTMDLLDGVSFLDWVRQGLGPSPTPEFADTVDVANNPTLEAATLRDASAFSTTLDLDPPAEVQGELDVPRLRDALRQLVNGISALHAGGMLHRDIKPSNVMVLRDGRVVLLDFGLVTHVEVRRPWQSQSDIGISGTIEYMAPEQSENGPPVPASDWYAVGVMLFQALTGRLPFLGAALKVLVDKRRFDAPSPSELVHDLPADLVDLCVRLLRRDPSARPGGAELSRALAAHAGARGDAPRPPVNTSTLIGRERPLGLLGEAWDEAVAGRGSAVYVHGSSGMGKSALIHRFLDALPDTALVLAGRCYERESVPYKALDLAIDELTTWLSTLSFEECMPLIPVDVLALARLFPVLRQVGAVTAQPPMPDIPDARELRRRAVGALRELFRRIGRRCRIVLHVDDLQWGDRDSAMLLADVLRPPEAPPMMLLGSYRTEEAETSEFLPVFRQRLLKRVGAIPVREIEVGPLAPDDARRLATELLGGGDDVTAGAAVVASESGGNPFLIEALVGYLRSGASAGGRLMGGTRLTLGEMMADRMSALPVDAQRLLTIVCVAGQPLARGVAQEAARLGADLPNALAILRAQHLVRVRVVDADELLESYHDRIRETVVEALSPEIRRREHLSVATALENGGRADVETLADHFLLADDLRKAGFYTARAAERAVEALAFDHAAFLFQRALEIARRRGIKDDAARQEERRLLILLAGALVDAGRCSEAATAYLEAAVGAPEVQALDLKRRAGEQLLISGHVDEGKKLLEGVLEAIDMKLPASPKRALASLLAWRARLRLRGLGFKPREAREVATTELSRIDLTWAVALGLGLVDHIRAADYQARSLFYSLESGERFRIARSLALEVAYAASEGQGGRPRVERLRKVADALVPAVDQPHTTGIYAYSLGVTHFGWGQWPESRQYFESAAQTFRDRTTGLNWEVASNNLFLLSSLGMLGELGEIARRVPPLLDDALARGNVYAATNLRTGYPCLTWLARDEPEVAREMVERAMAEWSKEGFHLQHYFDLVAETNLDLYCGRAASAWHRVMKAWPALEASMWHRVEIVRIDTFVYRARAAVAALAAGVDRDQSRAIAEKDARRLTKEETAWAWPNGWQTEAALRVLAGEPDAALPLLERAEAGFEKVSMPLHAASVRRRRGELLGGDAGASLITSADAALAAKGAVRPTAIADMLAPGFSRR